jgi:RNA polymerase subunit RPABC4/transcription elongation factor Spt4
MDHSRDDRAARDELRRLIMPIKNETSTHFMDEVRIISPWAFFFAVLGFAVPVAAMVFALLTDKTAAPPLPVMVPLVIVIGTAIACYVLLIGYVNRDAGRRGMSRLLWTLIAIFIPNALGIVLYFVLRKPRTLNCPQCGAVIEPGFGFCPRCRCRLNAVCPQCQRGVNAGDKFCPYCGRDLGTSGNTVSMPVPNQG